MGKIKDYTLLIQRLDELEVIISTMYEWLLKCKYTENEIFRYKKEIYNAAMHEKKLILMELEGHS